MIEVGAVAVEKGGFEATFDGFGSELDGSPAKVDRFELRDEGFEFAPFEKRRLVRMRQVEDSETSERRQDGRI